MFFKSLIVAAVEIFLIIHQFDICLALANDRTSEMCRLDTIFALRQWVRIAGEEEVDHNVAALVLDPHALFLQYPFLLLMQFEKHVTTCAGTFYPIKILHL